jgi:hypothetical protein
MSWYDYIPVAGSVARLAKGEYGHAAANLVPIVGPAAYELGDYAVDAYKDARREQKHGSGTAIDQARALGERQRQFQMEGLDRAQNYYMPAEQRLTAAYGSPGSVRK